MVNVLSSTLQASVFTGKNYLENLHSMNNTEDLTMKQMFDISEKLTAEQSDEIFGVNTINWEDSSWKYLSLIGDEEVISLSHAKVYIFSDSVLCVGKMNENPQSNTVWEDKLTWFKSSSQYRASDTSDGEPMEFVWNISRDSPHYSSATKSKSSCLKMSEEPEQFTGRIIFMSMFKDSSLRSKDNEQEWELSVKLVSILCEKIFTRKMVTPRTCIRKEVVFCSWKQTTRRMGQSRTNDDKICRERTPSFPIHESIIPRNAQRQRWWKIVNTLLRWWGNDWNCFRTINVVNQLSIYGAVSDLCEEYESLLCKNRDVFWQDNLTHCLCRQVWLKHLHLRPMILHKKKYCKNIKNEWASCYNKIV